MRRCLVSFKQYLKAEIAKGLDETYVLEEWAKDHPGRAYYDVHLSTIERHETATPIFRRHLGRGLRLGFTEFRYRKAEMDRFLARTNFEVLEVLPDDYRLPWSKGLFVDLCDVGSFFNYEPKPPYEFGPRGRAVVRAIQRLGLWYSSGGLFYGARAAEELTILR